MTEDGTGEGASRPPAPAQAPALPETIARLGAEMGDRYWKRKELSNSLTIGFAAAEHALAEATRLESTDAQQAATLREAGRKLLYNCASFSWPGWDEPGITVGAPELAAGRAAADRNLALTLGLARGPLPLSRANWMVGAHLLLPITPVHERGSKRSRARRTSRATEPKGCSARASRS